ncbi:bestrophin family ion channel [Acetobacteraceae bacterium ESL0709]|nr:bestrophin family ion channel [Acetobacteraceae bacterium ESL0697]MDF7678213.1 bestrophin family ion channel [Acetobacteraceae bacterium ESL0709]
MIVKRRYGLTILIKETLPSLTVLALWDFIVVILFQTYHQEWMEQPSLPISLMGSALALFLGIRNNAAYSRWWEGRTLWGSITNNCRSFGREVASLLNGRPDLAKAMAAYPYLLKAALSNTDTGTEVDTLLSAEMKKRVFSCGNRPNALLYEIGLEVRKEVDLYKIDGAVHGTIDRILSDLANAQGGLERIQKTPLPVQYSVLPNIVTHLFCVMLPLSAVQTLGWITPLGSSIIGLLFQMLDRSGRDLQEPFNDTVHALPMLTMARTIERDLLQPIGLIPHDMVHPHQGVQP